MSLIGGGSGSGAVRVPSDQVFNNVSARDSFFALNPDRLVQDAQCVVLDSAPEGLYQVYSGTEWQDRSAIVQGSKGDTGAQGLQGDFGQIESVAIEGDDFVFTDSSGNTARLIGAVTQLRVDASDLRHDELTNRNLADQHPISSITNLQQFLDGKAEAVIGKQLSDENYTLLEKAKLAGIDAGAQVNTVTSVAGKTGEVAVTKDDVGLGVVDNTSDVNKPVSSTQQAALNTKVDKVTGKQLSDENYTLLEKTKLAGIDDALDLKADNDDSRLTDSRDWIADEVGLEEAQLRSSGVYRKWSALRVGQAIVAWWESTGNQDTLDDLISSGDLESALAGKVDKVTGFGLSQASFTQAEKDKLATLEDSKFKGLFEELATLQAAYPTADAGSYAFIDGTAGNPNQLYVWATTEWEIVGGEVVSLTPSQVKQLLLENADTNNFSDSEKQKLEDAVTQTELASALTGYAATVHNHSIAQVTGLQAELDGKASSAHGHAIADVSGLQAALNGKAATVHNHSTSQVTGLDDALSNKVDKVTGKGLSTEDYTSADKSKLGGIAAGAQVNTVTSVAGKTGAIVVTKADVGLGSVDNTSDANKPVSSTQQTALNTKVDKVTGKQLSTNDYDNAAKQKVDGMGNAASRNVTTSSTDTTAGRLLKVGDFGVAGKAVNTPSGSSALDMQVNGVYAELSGSISGSPDTWGILNSYFRSDTAHRGYQLYCAQRSNLSQLKLYAQAFTGGETNSPEPVVTGWKEIYHTGNLQKATNDTPETNDDAYMTKKQVMDLLASKDLL